MLQYNSQEEFLELIQTEFQTEIEQNDLCIKLIKLNSDDVLILISKNNNNGHRINSTVMDSNIKYKTYNDTDGNIVISIYVYENTTADLFTKIKKTIFDLCLIK